MKKTDKSSNDSECGILREKEKEKNGKINEIGKKIGALKMNKRKGRKEWIKKKKKIVAPRRIESQFQKYTIPALKSTFQAE